MMLNRRRFLLAASAATLSGCKVFDSATRADSGLRHALMAAERLTMRSQRLLMGDALAPEFTRADIRQSQHPNGSTDPRTDEYVSLAARGFADYHLTVGGLVARPLSLSLADLGQMQVRTQITRHDCVEGWSCIAEWTGTPLAAVLARAEPLAPARYVVFHGFDEIERSLSGAVTYYESIDMHDARHPQTILAWQMNGAPLPVANGAPLRLRVERQLGYKMAKYIRHIELVSNFGGLGRGRGSYWADRGYEWYAGI
jgi:sulfoxide reductase catalytic subunit YedY